MPDLRKLLTLMVLLSFAVSVLAQESPGKPESMKAYSETIEKTKVDIPMVPIPVGQTGYGKTVLLGSPAEEPGRTDDEGPQVVIEVAPFWMGKYEVTWDAFDAFRAEYGLKIEERVSTDKVKTGEWADAVSLPTPLWEQDAQPILEGLGTAGGFPVADVSQYAARQFTKWLSKRTGHFYRLPTEAEWEYAARAGTTTAWFFGDDAELLAEYAWNFDTSGYDDPDKGYPGAGAGYRKVGTKKASPWGLHDIYGNVSEWVLDQHVAKGYSRLAGKSTLWSDAIVWPKTIFPCVTRGGNWESEPSACRSASRLASTPDWQGRDPQIPKSLWWYTDAFHVGFRIVRPLVEPSEAEKRRCWGDGEIPDVEEILTEGGKQARVPIKPAK